jgi:hypothetical protein
MSNAKYQYKCKNMLSFTVTAGFLKARFELTRNGEMLESGICPLDLKPLEEKDIPLGYRLPGDGAYPGARSVSVAIVVGIATKKARIMPITLPSISIPFPPAFYAPKYLTKNHPYVNPPSRNIRHAFSASSASSIAASSR